MPSTPPEGATLNMTISQHVYDTYPALLCSALSNDFGSLTYSKLREVNAFRLRLDPSSVLKNNAGY